MKVNKKDKMIMIVEKGKISLFRGCDVTKKCDLKDTCI